MPLILSLLLICSLLPPSKPGGQVASAQIEIVTSYDCEGEACAEVTFNWDNDRQQFRIQNNSDRRVKVAVTTFAGDSSVIVEPRKVDYLLVKTFNGPYRANYV
jgi:hypothetical protein